MFSLCLVDATLRTTPMDSLKRVVKVEKSTPESLNLRRIFGPELFLSCLTLWPDAASAERAVSLKLDIAGVRVLQVVSQPRLVDQYRVVNPSAFAEGDDLQSNAGTGRSSGLVRNELGGNRVERPNNGRPDNLETSSSGPQTSLLLQTLKSSDTPISHPSGPQADTVETRPKNRILMRLCGENITLDLRSLAGNPVTVIELLKVTSSERGNWLIVGAYYRRTGNPAGAREVVTAMLEALKQFNIPETELKPAFLLLSGCETDLGKLARVKGDTDKASEHYSNAQKWLHRVYGASLPPLAPIHRTRIGQSAAGTCLSPFSFDTGAPSAPRSSSPNPKILEREIQSLRDRHTHNTNVIADIRASKRKLEDTIEGDRRELDEVAKERDNARRMENLALNQMKREVDSRRRAEDRADEERELRRRAESSAEFAMLQGRRQSFSAFDSHPHRISF
ncbi:hypothetical protein B0H13DRAFT_1976807 [Mycena leptocephala]|nr:hypothetical protein B0H13DRAFT_1976807 [Mycena leptocephala]